MSANRCECCDPGCPCCGGVCANHATTTLYRMDMEDRTGTAMCEGCAADAMDSGLFSEAGDVDEESEEWDGFLMGSRPTMRLAAPRLEMRRPLMDDYPRTAAVVLSVLAGLLGLLGGF